MEDDELLKVRKELLIYHGVNCEEGPTDRLGVEVGERFDEFGVDDKSSHIL